MNLYNQQYAKVNFIATGIFNMAKTMDNLKKLSDMEAVSFAESVFQKQSFLKQLSDWSVANPEIYPAD